MKVETFTRTTFQRGDVIPCKQGADNLLLLNVRGEEWAMGYYGAGKFMQFAVDGSKHEVNILRWAYLNE